MLSLVKAFNVWQYKKRVKSRMKQIITMVKRILALLICAGNFYTPLSYAIMTEVYNLRISETTKRSPFEHDVESPWLINGTQSNGFRKKYEGNVTHGYVAGMGTVSYTKPTYYWRFDIAGGQVRSNNDGVHFSRNQLDDFLVSVGVSRSIDNKAKLTASGLFGIPLHPDTSLLHVQFGYGHVGLGAQGDGSFIFSSSRNHSLRAAVRCIHFLKRTVQAIDDGMCESFKFNWGNLIDLLIAYHWHSKKQRLEIGYDLTIFKGATIHPALFPVSQASDYIRNDFYANYKRSFKIRGYNNALSIAVSAGFDAKPKAYGYKRINVVWVVWDLHF
jgi:hypothetical protein